MSTHRRFEYKIETANGGLTKDDLDQRGWEGWELVQFDRGDHWINDPPGFRSYPYYYTFKRVIPEDEHGEET